MGRPLTFKQGLFVEHFLGESAGNAVDAARRAGYRVPEIVGRRVASKSIVQAAIAAKVAAAAMTSNEVLARVADLASVDLLEFLDIEPTGVFTVSPLNMQEWPIFRGFLQSGSVLRSSRPRFFSKSPCF